MIEEFIQGFWTAERRAWLYKIAVAAVPLLIAVGIVTGEMAQLIFECACGDPRCRRWRNGIDQSYAR
jgi:hypothetical protein